MDDKYIVGIGEVLFDIFPNAKKIGGAPANFAYHVARFGFKSKIISSVGNDDLGAELLKYFDDKNLEYDIVKSQYPTGTVNVHLDSLGVPTYDIKMNVAWENISFTKSIENIAKQTRVVSFGSLAQRGELSRQTIYKFLRSMSNEKGVYKLFDINLRQKFYSKEIIETSLELCNILKINDEELDIVTKMFELPDADFETRCRFLLNKYKLNFLILTCGTNGSYVFSNDTVSYQDTPKVEIADTVGAGDSFGAAFIASILKGETIEKSHSIAVKISAYICTQNGAMPDIPSEYL